MVKALLVFLMVSFNTFAWVILPDYPEPVYSVQGFRLDNASVFKKHIEIAYIPSINAIGVSFYNYKEDSDYIKNGTFIYRSCGVSSFGLIERTKVVMSKDNMDKFKHIMKCNKAFVHIFDGYVYTTYEVNNDTNKN